MVLAVDEPDASLHVSACHDQFAKLASVVDLVEPRAQVLLTTHWYGYLPIAQEGVAHSMTGELTELSFTSIDLYSYREDVKQKVASTKGKLPVDVAIKSYNDLVQSVVASVVRDDPYNWIFCEGTSDKIYLNHFLKGLVQSKKLRILPVGGFKEVRRIYEYLSAPIGDKEYDVKGRVLCLVDTDAQLPRKEIAKPTKNLGFKRVVFDAGKISLVNADSELSAPVTTIEDCLDPVDFYTSIHDFIKNNYPSDESLLALHKEYPLVGDASASYAAMDLRDTARTRLRDLFEADDNKVRFAKKYVENAESKAPSWIAEVRKFFVS